MCHVIWLISVKSSLWPNLWVMEYVVRSHLFHSSWNLLQIIRWSYVSNFFVFSSLQVTVGKSLLKVNCGQRMHIWGSKVIWRCYPLCAEWDHFCWVIIFYSVTFLHLKWWRVMVFSCIWICVQDDLTYFHSYWTVGRWIKWGLKWH